MFPNGSTKLRARERDATERSRHALLARLIASPAERQYQFESGDALPPSATVTLPLGFELRFDAANARFFFVDHAKRATTWQDPRNDPPDVAISNEATEAALRQLAELQRRQAEAARVASVAAGTGAVVSAASSDGTTAGRVGASGGEVGGRTGGGGAGTNPRAAGDGYVDAIVCPVQGGSAYGNTWGAPRSGGRRHQGVDMLAPTGTPLQAVVSGAVSHRGNRLGGITISLQGDNGNRYYYAHLVGYEGLPGRVEQGQVIGYIGDSGNATGIPHLHFEIRPGGGVPVNPYPSVRTAGC